MIFARDCRIIGEFKGESPLLEADISVLYASLSTSSKVLPGSVKQRSTIKMFPVRVEPTDVRTDMKKVRGSSSSSSSSTHEELPQAPSLCADTHTPPILPLPPPADEL